MTSDTNVQSTTRKRTPFRTFAGHGVRVAVVAAIGLKLSACSFVDLRSETLKSNGASDANVARGQALLKATAEQHGLNSWKQRQTTETVFRDDWDSTLARILGLEPWDEEDLVRFQYENGTFNITAQFVDGQRTGERVGIQAWKTYKSKHGEPVTFEDDSTTYFILPAMTYAFELPFRLNRAPLVVFDETVERQGKTYNKIFVTWNQLEPHAGADQYLLWINEATGLIDIAQYTIREQAKIFQGAFYYEDYRAVEGVQVAHTITIHDGIVDDPDDGYLHQVRVEKTSFDTVATTTLHPDSTLGRIADDKPQPR